MKTVEEIQVMLKWLQEHIDKWEVSMSEHCLGANMVSLQCDSSRIEYAGWLAQREFLRKLLVKAAEETYECPNCL